MITRLIAVVLSAGVLFLLPANQAEAGERYLSFDLIGGGTLDEFGGFNTAGGFSNADQSNDIQYGVAISYGLRDYWTLGNIQLSPELELAWFDDYSVSSASFPGLPAPAFLYNTSIQTGRLGTNVWWPVYQDALWRTEVGLGGGVVYRDVSTSDGVVAGSDDDFSGYGQVGIRALRSIGERSSLKFGINYVLTGETDVALNGGTAGELSVDTRSVDLRLGYEFKLN